MAYFNKTFTNKKKYFNPSSFGDTFGDSPAPLEAQVRRTENQMENQGIEVPSQTKRSVLDRVLDAVSITSYPIMGALKNITDDDANTTPFEGFAEGVKASNPFGQGYEKGETRFKDVLTNTGWETDETKPWYSGNNLGKSVAGFVGDVMLDPATYATFGTGAILKGTGKTLLKNSAKELAQEGFEKGMQELTETGAKRILEKTGQEVTPEAIEMLLKKVRRTADMAEPNTLGVSLSLANSPLGLIPGLNKTKFIKGKIDLVKPETMRALGDKTVAPVVNQILSSLGRTKPVQGLYNLFAGTSKLAKETARTDPEKYAGDVAFGMWAQDQKTQFKNIQSKFRQQSEEMFNELSPESRKYMTDLLESDNMFKEVERVVGYQDHIVKTPKAQEMYDGLVKAHDEIQNVVDKYNKLGVANEKIEMYDTLLNGIKNLSKRKQTNYKSLLKNNKYLNHLNDATDGEINNFFNQYIDEDVGTITNEFEKEGFKNPHYAAIETRAILDAAQNPILRRDLSARRYYFGQKSIPEVTSFSGGNPQTTDFISKRNKIISFIQNQRNIMKSKNLPDNVIDKQVDNYLKKYGINKNELEKFELKKKVTTYEDAEREYFETQLKTGEIVPEKYVPTLEQEKILQEHQASTIKKLQDKFGDKAFEQRKALSNITITKIIDKLNNTDVPFKTLIKDKEFKEEVINAITNYRVFNAKPTTFDALEQSRYANKQNLYSLKDNDLERLLYTYANEQRALGVKNLSYLDEVDSGMSKKMADQLETDRFNESGIKTEYANTLDETERLAYADKGRIEKLDELKKMIDNMKKAGKDNAEISKDIKYIMQNTDGYKDITYDELVSFRRSKGGKTSYFNKVNPNAAKDNAIASAVRYADKLLKDGEAPQGIDFLVQLYIKKNKLPIGFNDYEKATRDKDFVKSILNQTSPHIDSSSAKPISRDYVEFSKKRGNFKDNFGKNVPHNVYNFNGLHIYEKVGSPQDIKVSAVMDALTNVGMSNRKIKNLMPMLQVQLSDIKSWTNAITNSKGHIILAKEATAKLEDILAHEIAHHIGNGSEYYNSLFKSGEGLWYWIMNKSSEKQMLSNFKFYNFKLGQEDFAESVVRFLKNPKQMEQEFPERFKAVRDILAEYEVPKEAKQFKENVGQYFKQPTSAKQTAKDFKQRFKAERDNLISDLVDTKVPEEEARNSLKELDELVENNGNNDIFYKMFNDINPNDFVNEYVQKRIIETEHIASEKLKELAKKNVPMRERKQLIDSIEKVKNYYKKIAEEEKRLSGNKQLTNTIENYSPRQRKFEDDTKPANIFYDDSNVFARSRTVMPDEKLTSNINRTLAKTKGIQDFYELDQAVLYTTRGLKHNQYVYEKNFYNKLIEVQGNVINDVNSIPMGEKLYVSAEDVNNFISKIKLTQPDGSYDDIVKGYKLPKDVLESNKPIIEIDADTFVRLKAKDNSFEAFTLPELTAKHINDMGKLQLDKNTNLALEMYDRFLRLWKVWNTSINPGFHARNAVSNVFQSYLNVGQEVFNPETQLNAIKLMRKTDEGVLARTFIKTNDGKEYSLKTIKEWMNKLDVTSEGRFINESGSIAGANVNLADIMTNQLNKRGVSILDAKGHFDKQVLNPLSTLFGKPKRAVYKNEFLPYQVGMHVGSTVENYSKTVNFIANLINGKDFYEAAEMTKKFLFDYSDVTPFEANVMKRLIPFYTWMRKNVPLQIENLAKNSNVYRNYLKLKDTIEDMMPEQDKIQDKDKNKFAADWIQLPFKALGSSGENEPIFYNPNLPLGDLNKIPLPTRDFAEAMFASLTPYAKMPTEMLANKNVYFDTPISRGIGDSDDAPMYVNKLMGGTDEEPVQIDPGVRYILRNMNPLALENISKVLTDTKSKDAKFTTEEKSDITEGQLGAVKYLAGLSTYAYDVNKFKEWAYRDRLKQLRDIQKREVSK